MRPAELIKQKLVRVLKSGCPLATKAVSFALIGSHSSGGGKGAVLQLSNGCHVKPYKAAREW